MLNHLGTFGTEDRTINVEKHMGSVTGQILSRRNLNAKSGVNANICSNPKNILLEGQDTQFIGREGMEMLNIPQAMCSGNMAKVR